MKAKDWNDWRWQLQERLTTLSEINEKISLSEAETQSFTKASESFSFSVTPYYLSLIDPTDADCAIRKQILPREGELIQLPNEEADPLREESYMPVKGVTHRYPDRAIWYVSHVCAVYCRFCTRKRKVSHPNETPNKNEWNLALDYFNQTKNVREVILSGGDPLSLANSQIDFLLEELKKIPHINHVRIHTRYPVTLPMRLEPELCKIMSKHFPIYVVTHFNHPKEVTEESRKAIENLIKLGNAIVLNQSVLLKGINDNAKTLETLHFALVKIGVKPYYLHQCDEVFGSSDFVVPISDGIKIMEELRGFSSGITLPTYVKDLTGGGGKVLLGPNYFLPSESGIHRFKNYKGEIFETKH